MTLAQTALLCVFPALLLAAAVLDVATYTIPNWLSLALAGAFLAAAAALGLPIAQIGLHLGLGCAVLLLGMGLFAAGWMGGGDAKLLAAAALWLGPTGLAPMALATALAGGALTLCLMLLRARRLAPRAGQGPAWVARLADRRQGVPYGVAIAAGALAAFAASPLAAPLLTR